MRVMMGTMVILFGLAGCAGVSVSIPVGDVVIGTDIPVGGAGEESTPVDEDHAGREHGED